METSDRVVKGKPTAGTNGEVEKPARPTKGQECQHKGRRKVRERKKKKVKVGEYLAGKLEQIGELFN